jgi:hypothetical protein
MAFANFIDKAALNASQVLKNFDRGNFENILQSNIVEIAFDKNAVESSEGRHTLDLLVRLLVRLYPNIKFNSINIDDDSQYRYLLELAKSINPEVNISSDEPTIRVVVGKTQLSVDTFPTLYVGSENWIVKFSTEKAVGSSDYNNPFAAGIAACFASANIFRFVFKENLAFGDLDSDFQLSIFKFSKTFHDCGPEIKKVHLQQSTLVGLGAIGNGFVWALGRIDNATGDIDLVDGEKIELPNLQRYILADQQSVNQVKVDIASRYLDGERLRINPYPNTWEHFINERNNWSIDQVAVAVDSAKDRITIQGALPKKIFNSWTQLESLGISRHLNFVDSACVTCLYIPNAKKKNRSEEIAENLGLFGQQYEMLVRGYLALNKSVDENLISLVSTAKNIPIEVLRQYLGKPVDIFYSEFVCGGVMMKLSGENNSVVNVEVPCAFESAMAGILLAAEVVIDAEGLRGPIPPITRFNLLRPLSDYLLEDHAKHASGKCICQDEIFKNAYRSKYVIDK